MIPVASFETHEPKIDGQKHLLAGDIDSGVKHRSSVI
jgi:hypothetical protein